MTIPQIKTPGNYLEVNINTVRLGLPPNDHRVLFITTDPNATEDMPVNLYDKAQADTHYGENSQAGRMITAAIKTNRFVDVQGYSLNQSVPPQLITTESGQGLNTEDDENLNTEG
ncbi:MULTISPECIES: hypothetical protein [Acinetobacter]|uniref:Uncharacterized protein n=1 Tax=Acinetobacter higginsii TaxID=70347 RepID=N9T3D0_9GAMM|nr:MULTISPECIES: hypothetical protein [Acinetobacter]ENX58202.1 hypothetical protein F902_02602 [Acinetobacter higginsii]MCJ0829697.1 hypothetical protein [Acinetobacter sp. NIPH1876]